MMALAALAAGYSGAASAEPQSVSVYVEAGQSAKSDGRDTTVGTIGLRIPTPATFWGGSVSLAVDAYLSQWKTDAFANNETRFTQVGLVPMFRYRPDAGQSPWFVEGGIGVSYLDGTYHRGNQAFGSRWNFSDHLGVGRSFGADRRQELGVYLKHVSNAGLEGPNPGETFYQLRYSYRF
ncbi:acyloxyacyl hydrolase [Rhodoferax koreensis]|nr:acyloxyacyl hydrolase [Rhodoferax koreense]